MVDARCIDPAQESIDKVGLPALLQESWQRSMRHGLRRQDQALFGAPVTRAIEKRVVEENRFLLKHASAEMARLYTGLGSARWLSLCANTEGQVVCSVGDRASAPREIQTLMHPGRGLLETDLGTTAPGCALAAERPVVVERGEHFLFELSSFFCACSPIYGPNGQLAGVLDISGVDVESIPLANEMVGVAARAIENSMIRDIPACSFYRFHCDERLVGTPFEAILAVDADGLVRGANHTACQLLALPRDAALLRSVSTLFDKDLGKLRDQSRCGGFMQVRSTLGAIAHLVVESAPLPAQAKSTRAIPKPRTTLANGRPFVLRDADLLRNFERAASMLKHGLPVLLEGETGTGKEVLARALQEATRPDGPFVALNCAAIPEGLIEAELFGYADGAFTGGRRGGSPGKIEQANHGVLFLDEIGDMALGLQTRLLRVLQERVVTRVGEHGERPVDLLVLSATHSKLDELVARGAFREDLYYRLNGCTLRLPALRERDDLHDVAAELLIHFESLMRAGDRAKLDELITPEAFQCLVSSRWPGNIRQLEQTVRGLLALRLPPAPITLDDLPDAMRMPVPSESTLCDSVVVHPSPLEAAEEQVIRRVLQENGGNVSATARALGVSRTTIYAKLRRD